MQIKNFKENRIKNEKQNYINASSFEEITDEEGSTTKTNYKKPATWLIITLAAVCLAIIICLLIPLNKSIAQNDCLLKVITGSLFWHRIIQGI